MIGTEERFLLLGGSDTEKTFLISGETITSIAAVAPPKKQKNSFQKEGEICPLGGIANVEMTAAEDLENIRTKLTRHW